MFIQNLKVVNFRCFPDFSVHFNHRFTIIQGKNGTGKSSVLEALHYGCYLRSFRTHLNRELVALGQDHFFIQIGVGQEGEGVFDTINVGFSDESGKVVKYNEKAIQSYKELIAHYRIITLTADDLLLVHGAPEERRDFLNYALLFFEPTLLTNLRRYKQILEQRNGILQAIKNQQRMSGEELRVWTEQLWHESQIIKRMRIDYLQQLEVLVNSLLQKYFSQSDEHLEITFMYHSRGDGHHKTFHDFWKAFEHKGHAQEMVVGRSCFGIHLDDFSITFAHKKARVFASRGQQKLIVFLIKIAQLLHMEDVHKSAAVLLLDDFLTDFDEQRVEACFSVLHDLSTQVLITCPVEVPLFKHKQPAGFALIKLP